MCPHCALALLCMAVDSLAALDAQAWIPVLCRARKSRSARAPTS